MKSIEATGKTVEDAVKNGLKQLGLTSSDVNTEIISMGSPGLFGMFGKLAKVRLTEKEPEIEIEMPTMSFTEVKVEHKYEAPKPEKKPEPKPAPVIEKSEAKAESKIEEKVIEKVEEKTEEKITEAVEEAAEEITEAVETEEAADAAEEQTEEAKPHRKRSRSRNRKHKGENKSEEKPVEAEETEEAAPSKVQIPFEVTDPETLGKEGKIAHEFITGLTQRMGIAIELQIIEDGDNLTINMQGDTLGVLIGHRGETLDALQYLTSLQVNKGRRDYMRVTIDTENYRAKREEALTKLALRMAGKVRRSGRRMALEPMNPYERRILHSVLQNNRYVETHSEGEEPYRRVIITPKEY